jgi:hypothetical protein
MQSIRLVFTRAVYEVAFESDELFNQFSRVFCLQGEHQDKRSDDQPIVLVTVAGSDGDGFAVLFGERMIRERMTMPEAACCVTQMISDAFCSWVDDEVCVMHAASVLRKDKLILFSGVSGSGKTSLALEFARHGKFAGDECAFLDMGRATAWYEEFPFQLKANNRELLSRYDKNRTLEVYGDLHGTAFYLPLDSVDSHPVKRDDNIVMSTIVFPRFHSGSEGVSIRRLAADRLPEYILNSLMGTKAPSNLFAQFVHMSARHGLRFYDIKYSDLAEAADELEKYLVENGV